MLGDFPFNYFSLLLLLMVFGRIEIISVVAMYKHNEIWFLKIFNFFQVSSHTTSIDVTYPCRMNSSSNSVHFDVINQTIGFDFPFVCVHFPWYQNCNKNVDAMEYSRY